MQLTKEELAELEALEGEEEARQEAAAIAAKRQHLDAMRLRKKLAAKHGTHGRDFMVIETVLGNFAMRRAQDVEVDNIDGGSDRSDLEKLAMAITLEPSAIELQKLMAEHHGLVGTLVSESSKMLKVLREEETRK